MPLRFEWLSRIKAVEREFVAMRKAADRFRRDAQIDPTILTERLRFGEIVTASENLEATYTIRMFAEFETGARQYWLAKWGTFPRTVELLDGLAARRKIPELRRENAQWVRLYRNSLVHEREDVPASITITAARSHLCHFFSYLPRQW
jgi:hypothetical protein